MTQTNEKSKGGMNMNHIKALGIKWIIVAIVTFSLFGIFHYVSLGQLLLMSVIIALTSYVLGDLLILPRIGNVFATLADFAILFVLFAVLGNGWMPTTFPIILASLAGAFFISITEPLYHTYLIEHIFPRERTSFPLRQLQTEASEELDPDLSSEDRIQNGENDSPE